MKLAIVSSYDEQCALASYAKSIKNTFSKKFDVTVFDLKSAALVGNPLAHNSPAAEAPSDQICHDLADYDCVNVQLEWGLFGADLAGMQRRLLKLFNASKRLIVTLHTLNIRSSDAREWQEMETAVLESLKKRDDDHPYWVITHLSREAEAVRSVLGIDNVVDFPLVFLSRQEVQEYQKNDPTVWKESLGFKKDDVVILRFGFLASHKDSLISLKLLRLLPQNYKLAFIGGQHPRGIVPYTVSPLVKELTDYIDDYDAAALEQRNHYGAAVTTLGDRVCFLGHVSDEEFYRAAACADFITLTHLETSQGGSGSAAVALQMERPVILSFNSFFMEYEKYYKEAFSFFTMGNHYELRDKIMNFDPANVERLKICGQKYSLEKLTDVYEELYQNMLNGKGNNTGRKTNAQPAIVRQRSVPAKIFFKALGYAKRLRYLIRRMREIIRSELA
jgi:glycosyltransferase involved in cell wall biosynthesis